MSKPWTETEIAQAKQLWADGLSEDEIAQRVGRTGRSVDYILRKRDSYSEGRVCSECPNPIANRNRSGLCRDHFNKMLARDPAIQAKKFATLRQSLATNPAMRVERREQARRAAATRWANPDYAEATTRRMREDIQPKSLLPEHRHHRVAAARASAEKRIGWCPPEYRDLYRSLINNKGFRKAEAKPMILAQIAADKARATTVLSPFERQQRALERGAQLVANDVGPRFGEVLKAVGE